MKARLIYTGIRVKDLEKSLEFYTKLLGMKVTGRTKVEATKGETVGLVSEDGDTSSSSTTTGKGASSTRDMASGKAWITSRSRWTTSRRPSQKPTGPVIRWRST